jgi:hypothetical protein
MGNIGARLFGHVATTIQSTHHFFFDFKSAHTITFVFDIGARLTTVIIFCFLFVISWRSRLFLYLVIALLLIWIPLIVVALRGRAVIKLRKYHHYMKEYQGHPGEVIFSHSDGKWHLSNVSSSDGWVQMHGTEPIALGPFLIGARLRLWHSCLDVIFLFPWIPQHYDTPATAQHEIDVKLSMF